MLENDPLWYKDTIIYELHVRAFHDSVGDGIGDFRGLADKLDYLQDLGITAIWLLPFYPSPLKDDGYDIADYTSINHDYGNLRDFKLFLKEAHKRGLRVITELVINHTSDQHPWFRRARRSPAGSVHRDFYVWSDTTEKFKEARIIFQDFEHSNWTYDSVAKAYYWHRFYSHQPDLNYDNPEVWKAIFPILDFWMEMGVDGLRLDAVPYLFEREGTNCENLPETHNFLKELRKHVDGKFINRMLLAEANQWPEDAVAYFGDGDECHMAFHFPVMPRMFMAIHMEDRFPIIDIMDQTPPVPSNCQWCMFLRNHDELTLEMVTDEERDYMYRAYATDPRARINLGIRRRLAPLLGNNRRRIELMNALLFSLPGTPVIYYGEEIGMGDNFFLGDRNSVRTPMQWSSDRNAGFSRANPQRLYLPVIIDPEYHYEAVNVEAQQNNPNSLLWWMKRLIALRKQYKAFGRGSLQFLHPENRKILAFLRRYKEECIMVVANLSRFVQYVELDLSEFQGNIPVELFGRNPFPPIGKLPYLLTLAPHSFYWFSLESHTQHDQWDFGVAPTTKDVHLLAPGGWEELLIGSNKSALEKVLPSYLKQRRWFGGKARPLKLTTIKEAIPVKYADTLAYVLLIHTEFSEGSPETYLIPISFVSGERAEFMLEEMAHFVITKVQSGAEEGVLFDALGDTKFCSMILEAIRKNEPTDVALERPTIVATAFSGLEAVLEKEEWPLHPTMNKTEQSNTSILFGNHVILKVFRRVDEGLNPELEIGRYLTQSKKFLNIAPLLGFVELRRRKSEPTVLAILQQFVTNEGDAWQYTLDELSSFFELLLTSEEEKRVPPKTLPNFFQLAKKQISELAQDTIGNYLQQAALLGKRTGELHIALASEHEDPHFIPEPYSKLYQRSVYQSMRNLVGKGFQLLQRRLPKLEGKTQEQASKLLGLEAEVLKKFQSTFDGKLTAMRTRLHGDFHLGQVLSTGKDFVIIDFEGEPARSINDRRIKRSPLRDVAGMIRSFHYAVYSALFGHMSGRGRSPGLLRPEDVSHIEVWANFWYNHVSGVYLHTYLETTANHHFLPKTPEECRSLLEAFLLEKAIYELGYELNHRPNWVQIPLLGILRLLDVNE